MTREALYEFGGPAHRAVREELIERLELLESLKKSRTTSVRMSVTIELPDGEGRTFHLTGNRPINLATPGPGRNNFLASYTNLYAPDINLDPAKLVRITDIS